MPLSWNEIRSRALTFSKEWAEETSEDAEAKSFRDGFFNIFGITRRRVASSLAPFPYVNGQLFLETLPIPAFDRAMREALLDCCALDWSRLQEELTR